MDDDEPTSSPRVVRKRFDSGIGRPETGAVQVRGDELTRREEQIMTLISLGLTNLEVASVLGLSEKTVKFHMGTILEKLPARNRTHAVIQWCGVQNPRPDLVDELLADAWGRWEFAWLRTPGELAKRPVSTAASGA